MYLSPKNMSEEVHNIQSFDPSGVGVHNGRFIGLPFSESEALIVLLPVPWDVTVSFGEGTASGPANILDASSQLDLEDPFVKDAWKLGLFMRQPDKELSMLSSALRKEARACIDALESGQRPDEDPSLKARIHKINEGGAFQMEWVRSSCEQLLRAGKLIGLVGGDHSCPLGFLQALADHHGEFGILQIDAHMDLRSAYEGFEYSHASIFYNALKIPAIRKITQVGIRDYCQEEIEMARQENTRVEVFFDHDLQDRKFSGETWKSICERIVSGLPQDVYLSFDIDGLDPSLCPNTGTPVPGGLMLDEALYLIRTVVASGRKIIGFDLCEVAGAPHVWDANVGARLLYRISNQMAISQGMA